MSEQRGMAHTMKRYLLAAAALALCEMMGDAYAANIYWQPRPAGGSYLFITGQIVDGDDQTFTNMDPPAPVYVRPSGPGGATMVELAIGDMIAQRGWNTMNSRLDGTCASSCALIWLSGYSSHMIADWNSMIGFHSCYDRDTNLDDTACDAEIARHLVNYGFTPRQANVLAYISPHEQMTRAPLRLRRRLACAGKPARHSRRRRLLPSAFVRQATDCPDDGGGDCALPL